MIAGITWTSRGRTCSARNDPDFSWASSPLQPGQSSAADKGRPTWEQMQDLAIEIQPVSFAKAAGFRQQGSEKEDASEEVEVETVNR